MPQPHWTPLTSSYLSGMSYNPETRELDIRFKNGRIYSYYNVPPNVAEDMLTASSAGEFYSTNIKGQYA
jgi:hypothetical protein